MSVNRLQLTDDYFESLINLKPYMEDYNRRLISHFEHYLSTPSVDNLMTVFRLRKESISSASNNAYLHINRLHSIMEIAMRELGAGFIPITSDTILCDDAINKYVKTIFMLRRHNFMTNERDIPLLDEAVDYVFLNNISPISIYFIITNELIGNKEFSVEYWKNVFILLGHESEAVFLERLNETEGKNGSQ